jgi:hypothetical protein
MYIYVRHYQTVDKSIFIVHNIVEILYTYIQIIRSKSVHEKVLCELELASLFIAKYVHHYGGEMRKQRNNPDEEWLYSQNEQDKKMRIWSRLMQAKEKIKNSDIENGDGVNNRPSRVTTITIIIVVVISISVTIRILFPEFDLLKDGIGIFSGNDNTGCFINLFGSCTQVSAAENTPTATPVPPATIAPTSIPPSPTPFVCTKDNLPSGQTDTVKVTVNSVSAEKNYVDMYFLTMEVTIENLANSVMQLPLLNNLVIIQSGTSDVISNFDAGLSSKPSTLPPFDTVDMTIIIASLSDKITSFDMKFLYNFVDESPVRIDLFVNNIPIPC